jgi:hypothetical protein
MLFSNGNVTCNATNPSQTPQSAPPPPHRHNLRDPNHTTWLTYPKEDVVQFGKLGVEEVGVRVDDVILANCHGAEIDLVDDALGVARLEVKPKGTSWWRDQKEEGDQEE